MLPSLGRRRKERQRTLAAILHPRDRLRVDCGPHRRKRPVRPISHAVSERRTAHRSLWPAPGTQVRRRLLAGTVILIAEKFFACLCNAMEARLSGSLRWRLRMPCRGSRQDPPSSADLSCRVSHRSPVHDPGVARDSTARRSPDDVPIGWPRIVGQEQPLLCDAGPEPQKIDDSRQSRDRRSAEFSTPGFSSGRCLRGASP